MDGNGTGATTPIKVVWTSVPPSSAETEALHRSSNHLVVRVGAARAERQRLLAERRELMAQRRREVAVYQRLLSVGREIIANIDLKSDGSGIDATTPPTHELTKSV
jgi:hypothetical protein